MRTQTCKGERVAPSMKWFGTSDSIAFHAPVQRIKPTLRKCHRAGGRRKSRAPMLALSALHRHLHKRLWPDDLDVSIQQAHHFVDEIEVGAAIRGHVEVCHATTLIATDLRGHLLCS